MRIEDNEEVQCWIDGSESVLLRTGKCENSHPVVLTAEAARSVARKLIELSIQVDFGSDGELSIQDWIRIPMQYVHIHCQQDPAFDHDEDFAGADVECWIKDQTEKNALIIAKGWIEESGWQAKEVEQQVEVLREDYKDGDEDVSYYDQAIHDEQVFVYNVYSNDSPE